MSDADPSRDRPRFTYGFPVAPKVTVTIDGPFPLTVREWDQFVNVLTAVKPGLTESVLVQELAAWKADVDSEPIPQLVDTDTALAVVARNQPGRSRRIVAALRGMWRR